MTIRPLLPAALVLMSVLGACGGDDITLSEAGARGAKVFDGKACANCHGPGGKGGLGPTLRGLPGSEVELEDGTVVVADDDYIRRAIQDPSAQIADGYSIEMTPFDLTDEQVDDLVAYIHDLSAE